MPTKPPQPEKLVKTASSRSEDCSKVSTINLLKNLKGEHAVAVGLSGGVDSSLTAALLVEAGWLVEGLTLWLMPGKGSCCSDGLVDAAGICEQLSINHHIVDSRSTFQKEIVEELVNGYQQGITPLPCSKCNRSVKFGPMLNWAQKNLKINRIATGHYARIRYSTRESPLSNEASQRHQLLRGVDVNKDQSYFLYDLSQEVLGKVIFPLGELSKSKTRQEAEKYGLRTAKKPESQDLCLAEHHGSMKAFLDNYLPPREGSITLQDGTIIGSHDGIEHFTIGQRKGLGIAWSEPLYVIEIDNESNNIVVAGKSDAGKLKCIVGNVNWVSISPPTGRFNAEVQVRYRGRALQAEIRPIEALEEDYAISRPYRCEVLFQEEQFSITPGQAAVFYSGEVLLGGGIIQKSR